MSIQIKAKSTRENAQDLEKGGAYYKREDEHRTLMLTKAVRSIFGTYFKQANDFLTNDGESVPNITKLKKWINGQAPEAVPEKPAEVAVIAGATPSPAVAEAETKVKAATETVNSAKTPAEKKAANDAHAGAVKKLKTTKDAAATADSAAPAGFAVGAGTIVETGSAQDIPYSIAEIANKTATVFSEISSWFVNATYVEKTLNGGGVEYEVAVTFDDKAFKAYAVDKKLYKQARAVPLIEHIPDWWNHLVNSPWLSKETIAVENEDGTKEEAISLFYNVVLLAANPTTGGTLKKLKDLSASDITKIKEIALAEGHQIIIGHYGKETEEDTATTETKPATDVATIEVATTEAGATDLLLAQYKEQLDKEQITKEEYDKLVIATLTKSIDDADAKAKVEADAAAIEAAAKAEVKAADKEASWRAQARVPGDKLSDWLHLRVEPQPPHIPESINYAMARVQINKSTTDALHTPYESIEELGDLPGAASISKVEFYSAKDFKIDMDFLSGVKAGEEQSALYYYADKIKSSDYKFTPDLDLESIGDLIKTFYDHFVNHLRSGPESVKVDTKEVFHKDSEYAFEMMFDGSYNIVSIKLLKPKKDAKFDFTAGNIHSGVVANIGATKMVYVKGDTPLPEAQSSAAEALTSMSHELKSTKKEVVEKTAAMNSKPPPKFQKTEVVQSPECMFLLYNIRTMIYHSEGFPKDPARRATWQNFVDKYIYPKRVYVEEPSGKEKPKEKYDAIDKTNVSIATRKTANEQTTKATDTDYKKAHSTHRKESKDNIEDLYTTKEPKEEQNVVVLENTYKGALSRKDVRTFASKAVQCLWPKFPEDITETLFEAATDKVCANDIIAQLVKTPHPSDPGKTIFDFIENTQSDDEFSGVIKNIQSTINEHRTTMHTLLEERDELKEQYYEQLANFEEAEAGYEELLLIRNYATTAPKEGGITLPGGKTESVNFAGLQEEINEAKAKMSVIQGTSEDSDNTSNSNSLAYLETQLKKTTNEQLIAETAYSRNIGEILPPDSKNLAKQLKDSLKNKETKLTEAIALQEKQIKDAFKNKEAPSVLGGPAPAPQWLAEVIEVQDLGKEQIANMKAELNEFKDLKKTVSKNITSLVPGYSKLLNDAKSASEDFSYDKVIRNLIPKKITLPDIPRIPTDDIMPNLYADLKKIALEIASSAINGLMSKLIKSVTNYCEEGKNDLKDALGYGDLLSVPGAKNLNSMMSSTSKQARSAKKIFDDFGITTGDFDEDEEFDYDSGFDDEEFFESDPFNGDEPPLEEEGQNTTEQGGSPGLHLKGQLQDEAAVSAETTMSANNEVPRTRNVPAFERFLDDISAVLTPKELCTLISGKPSHKTLTYIDRIIDVGYPEMRLSLNTKTKTKALFKKLGALLPKGTCDSIRRGLNDLNVKYEEICPPGDPKINYREALIEERLTPEQNTEMLEAIRQARKDAFIEVLDIATSDPDTYFDNLYKEAGAPGQEECTDPRTGTSYARPRNNCGNAAVFAKFTSPKTDAEDYLTDLVRDTVFAPVMKTFSADIQNFFSLVMPKIPKPVYSKAAAKQKYADIAKPGAKLDAAVFASKFAGQRPMPLYRDFVIGFTAATSPAGNVPEVSFNALGTAISTIATVYAGSWYSYKFSQYTYYIPFIKEYEDPNLLENNKTYTGTPFDFRIKPLDKFSSAVSIKNTSNVPGGLASLPNDSFATWLSDKFKTDVAAFHNLPHSWQGYQFRELTSPKYWDLLGGSMSVSAYSSEINTINQYLEYRLFPYTTQGLFGLVFQSFYESYFWRAANVKRLSRVIRDTMVEAVGKDFPRPDINKNLLELEKVKNAAKRKEEELKCDAPQGAILGPGPFETSNIESTVTLLMRVYAIELALGNLVSHSTFDMMSLIIEEGIESPLVEYLTNYVINDLSYYRGGQAQLATKNLDSADYPEDVLLAVHGIMVNRKKSGEKFFNPVTRKPYKYELFELGDEGDRDAKANQKLPEKYAAASGWVGQPEFKKDILLTSRIKGTKVSDAQMKAELKHMLWEQLILVFAALSKDYMLTPKRSIDDWFIDKLRWDSVPSHSLNTGTAIAAAGFKFSLQGFDFFDRLPTTDASTAPENIFPNPKWKAGVYTIPYIAYSAKFGTTGQLWEALLEGEYGSGGVWSNVEASDPWKIIETITGQTPESHTTITQDWGGDKVSKRSPFLLGWATEALFGDVIEEPSRTGLYLQPYINVEWNPDFINNDPAHPFIAYISTFSNKFPNLFIKGGSIYDFGGIVNLKEWVKFSTDALFGPTFGGVNTEAESHKKYFKWAWGLRLVIVTEPGSVLKKDNNLYNHFQTLYETTKGLTNKKLYAHTIHKVFKYSTSAAAAKNDLDYFGIEEDFIFSIPLADVQIPIIEDLPLNSFSKKVGDFHKESEADYINTEKLSDLYPYRKLQKKMKNDPTYRRVFKKIFNLPQIASCASIIGHNILSTTPGYSDAFKNTKSVLRSIFYTMHESHDYKHESEGLKVAHTYSDTLFGGDVMNTGGPMPINVSKMARMTQHIIIESIADLIEPSWDWTSPFNYTVPGMLATVSDFMKPEWFDDAKADEHFRDKKRSKGTKPQEGLTTKKQSLDIPGSVGFKKVGSK